MFEKLEKLGLFLRQLQRSDRNRKKRWLAGLTAVAMVLVVALWSIYINTVGLPVLTPSASSGQGSSALSDQAARDDGRSTWDIFKSGLNEIFSNAKAQFETSRKLIDEQLKKTNEVVVENEPAATSTASSSEPEQ